MMSLLQYAIGLTQTREIRKKYANKQEQTHKKKIDALSFIKLKVDIL